MPPKQILLQRQRRTFERSIAQLISLGRLPSDVTISPDFYPVYVFSTDELLDRNRFANKQPTSVQFSASADKGKKFAIGEVNSSEPEKMIGMRYGDSAARINNALQRAGSQADASPNHTGVQMVRIPELSLEGVSVKPKKEEDRLFLAFTPSPKQSPNDDFVPFSRYLRWVIDALPREQRDQANLVNMRE